MKKFFLRKFDPRARGLRQILGDLETDIIEVIWEHKEITVRRTYVHLKEKRDLAYTTVMTVMSRLVEKGILKRSKKGSAYFYKAVLNRDDFIKAAVKGILGNLLKDFTTPAINQFVELLDDVDPEKIEELAVLIEKKRSQKNA